MSKKKELSPELKAECDTAKALFVSRKNALGLTQASLADAADISAAAVAMYLNGTNPLNAKFAAVLSRLLGVPVEKFSKRLAKEISGLIVTQNTDLPEDSKRRPLSTFELAADGQSSDLDHLQPGAVGDEVWISHYHPRTMAGHPQPEYAETLQSVRVSPRHLREMGIEFKEHFHLKLGTGWGQSMAPTIKHRDPLLVDTSIREFIGDGIYIFTWESHLYIKRLQWIGEGRFNMISDNNRIPQQTIRAEDTFIQARVLFVWSGSLA